MSRILFIFRWGWLLGVALLVPVALPAGGGDLYKTEIITREHFDPLVTPNNCLLRSTPELNARVIRTLQLGTPLRVLRQWHGIDGEEWLHVQIAIGKGADSASAVKRGWVNV